ncbi:hypothetical protein D3C86_1401190 [compost metagenome]
MGQPLRGRHAAAIYIDIAHADQRARHMRQRGEVAAGAHRALGRDARRDAVVGQRQQRLDHGRAHARMTAREADGLHRQDQAHGVRREVRAGAHAVGEHEVALQLGQLVMRNARLGQLAEAGVDAVDHGVGVDDVLHGGLRRAHAGPGRVRHRQAHLAPIDAAQVGQGDVAGVQRQYGAGIEAGIRNGCHVLHRPVGSFENRLNRVLKSVV